MCSGVLVDNGVECVRVAWGISGLSQGDEVVQGFRESVRNLLHADKFLGSEGFMFVCRDASGEGFDVYLLGEDSVFIACAAGVSEGNVMAAAEALIRDIPGRSAYYERYGYAL